MLKRSLILIVIIISLSSCRMGRVLVITDYHWDRFCEEYTTAYHLKRYIPFFKNRVIPQFEVYAGNSSDFLEWYGNIINTEAYESILLTFPFSPFLNDFQSDFSKIIIMGGAAEFSEKNIRHVVNGNTEALFKAGRELHRLWSEENRIPVIVFWKRDRFFEKEFLSLKKGWGDQNLNILEQNLLILDKNSSDRQGKIKSFYSKLDFQNGKWTLLVYAEPALAEVFKTWPYDNSVYGILAVPENKVLPENIKGIITRNFMGILEESARLSRQDFGEKTITVDAIFKNR